MSVESHGFEDWESLGFKKIIGLRLGYLGDGPVFN